MSKEREKTLREIHSRTNSQADSQVLVAPGGVTYLYGATPNEPDPTKASIVGWVREDALSDIWAADKVLHNGKWYVSLSEVSAIMVGNKIPDPTSEEWQKETFSNLDKDHSDLAPAEVKAIRDKLTEAEQSGMGEPIECCGEGCCAHIDDGTKEGRKFIRYYGDDHEANLAAEEGFDPKGWDQAKLSDYQGKTVSYDKEKDHWFDMNPTAKEDYWLRKDKEAKL